MASGSTFKGPTRGRRHYLRDQLLHNELQVRIDREVGLVRELEAAKKREVDLLQHCTRIEADRHEWWRLCKGAMASMKELEAEVVTSHSKQADMESQIMALRSQLARMDEDKQKQADRVAEKATVSKKLACCVNRVQVSLLKHVSVFTLDVQGFQRIFGGANKGSAPSSESSNQYGVELASNQTTNTWLSRADEQKRTEDQQYCPNLVAKTMDLVEEILRAHTTMNQAANDWKLARGCLDQDK